jgi:hypothetical protein
MCPRQADVHHRGVFAMSEEKVDHLMEAQKALTPKMRTPDDCFTVDHTTAHYHLLLQIVEQEGRHVAATEALVKQVKRVADALENRPNVITYSTSTLTPLPLCSRCGLGIPVGATHVCG